MSTKKCRTCLNQFEGPDWMKQCRACYADFKGKPRIEVVSGGKGVFIQAHPSVTQEEVNDFILKKYGSVNDPSNWWAVTIRVIGGPWK